MKKEKYIVWREEETNEKESESEGYVWKLIVLLIWNLLCVKEKVMRNN